jgi:hypothetical protein
MDPTQERQVNQAAYRQLKDFIQTSYPPGRYVAISGGRIIADAARSDELDSLLRHMGYHPPDVLVVQAGVDNPETVTIFVQQSWLRPAPSRPGEGLLLTGKHSRPERMASI